MMVLRADNESVLFGGRIGSVVVAAAAARRPPRACHAAGVRETEYFVLSV